MRWLWENPVSTVSGRITLINPRLITAIAGKLALVLLTFFIAACSGGGGGGGGGTVIRISDASLTEGDAGQSNLLFTISLSAAEADTVTVDYATSPGSATTGVDFIATNGTATFSAGDTEESVTVSIVGDTDEEPDENFTVALSNVTGNATIADGTGLGTIQNDDSSVPVGLAQRPDNTTCIAPDRPTADTGVATENAFPAA
ncbi:MAG: Calx-beta domain-containing protein, partial [Gammaproteobacteria bacterium]